MRRSLPIFGVTIALALLIGCAPKRLSSTQPCTIPSELSPLTVDRDVDAYVTPPRGWTAEPLKSSPQHKHQVWLSPTRQTAYGVIYFTLPLPVGFDIGLWGFLQEMKRTEGQATLLEKHWDENHSMLRFVALGGLHRVEVSFFVDGWHGWAVYAGSLRDHPIIPGELSLARSAREHTLVGLKGTDRR